MIARRHLLGAGLILPALSSRLLARAAPATDPLELFLRLRCSPEGQNSFWSYSGHMLGRVDREPMRPILSVIGASRSRIQRQPDGSVVYNLIEAGYYGDPETGGIADAAIVNRLTGAPMTPQHYLSPQSIRFTRDLRVLPETRPLPPGMRYEGRITPPDIKAGRLWMAEELFIHVPPRPATATQPGRGANILNSLANFEAAMTDIESSRDFVPASMQYTTLNSFRPWMNMGAATGDIMMRLNGIKLARWNQLPAMLRARIEADHGDALHD
jgi:Protein of unknown function (DUF1838)